MATTIRTAREFAVVVGAHPSYPDRAGFGRRSNFTAASDLPPAITNQLEKLLEQAAALGAQVRHVKPHGALYSDSARDPGLARAVCTAITAIDRGLAVYGPPDSELERAAAEAGLVYIREGFVDRAYAADGSLVPRSEPGSVYADAEVAARQAVMLASGLGASAITGERVPLHVQTLCIHGDTPGAVETATAVAEALGAAGVRIAPPQ